MKFLSTVFLASLLFGQIGGIPVFAGAVIYIHDVILGLVLIEGFVQYAIISKFVQPVLIKPIILFIGIAIVSLLANSGMFAISSLEISSLYLVRWVFYATLYVLVRQQYTRTTFWLYGLFAVGVVLGMIGLAQFLLYPDLRNLSYLGWDPHYFRLFSTFLDPNFAGIFLVLTLLLGFYLWQIKKYRVGIAIGMLISIISVLLTYSRSSYLAMIAGFVLVTILKKQWILIIAVCVLIVTMIFLPKTSGSTLDLFRVDSTVARIGNWQQGIALIHDAPVLGHGFNTLRYISADSGPVVSRAAAGLDSSILFVGATVGLVGMVMYGYLMYSMIRLGQMVAARKKHAALGIVYLSCIGAVGIHSFFVNSAFYPWVMIWIWILTGVVERSSDGK